MTSKPEEAIYSVDGVTNYSGGLIEWMEEQLSNFKVSDELSASVMTVGAEIESNLLNYAFHQAGEPPDGQKFKVTLTASNEQLKLTFLDTAPPFNPLEETSEMSENLEEGGRGIPLIKKLPDKVEYERTADGQNKLTAHFNLP